MNLKKLNDTLSFSTDRSYSSEKKQQVVARVVKQSQPDENSMVTTHVHMADNARCCFYQMAFIGFTDVDGSMEISSRDIMALYDDVGSKAKVAVGTEPKFYETN